MNYQVTIEATDGKTYTEVVPAPDELTAILRAGVSLANKGIDGYNVALVAWESEDAPVYDW